MCVDFFLSKLEVAERNAAAPERKRRKAVGAHIFLAASSCRGRHVASRMAMPADIPERKGWRKEKVSAQATRMDPPSSGPSPKRRDTRNPDASSPLPSEPYMCERGMDRRIDKCINRQTERKRWG